LIDRYGSPSFKQSATSALSVYKTREQIKVVVSKTSTTPMPDSPCKTDTSDEVASFDLGYDEIVPGSANREQVTS
jgi:hypothetical protein